MVIQQLRTVAGDEDLRMLAGIHERIQEDAGSSRVESYFGLFDAHQGYPGLLPIR